MNLFNFNIYLTMHYIGLVSMATNNRRDKMSNEYIIDKLKKNYPGRWLLLAGHAFHNEANSGCTGDIITVSDKDFLDEVAFECCSYCGDTREIS